MNHIFCSYSSVVGHLGCFQLLAITNKAAMNIVEHVLHGMVWHLLGIFPRVELLGLQVDLFPIFWGTSRLISRMVVPVCNPTSNGEVFLFLLIFSNVLSTKVLILAILFFSRYFLYLHFTCYPRSLFPLQKFPILSPPPHAHQPTHSCLLALAFPYTGV